MWNKRMILNALLLAIGLLCVFGIMAGATGNITSALGALMIGVGLSLGLSPVGCWVNYDEKDKDN